MIEQELQERRRAKWRLTGPQSALRNVDDAAQFMASVGLCLVYPAHPPLLAPTFIGACLGSGDNLPGAHQAFKDPRTPAAMELMLRLLRQRSAYEVGFAGETNLLISAEAFPYFYALAGDRNPRRDVQKSGNSGQSSQLARDAYTVLQREGPVCKRRLLEILGGALTEAALDRALSELWAQLRITRVDYRPGEGIFWDALYRWSPEAVKKGSGLSMAQGLSALLSKYLEAVVAVETVEIEAFFSNMAARSRVREAVNAMLAAREFSFVQMGRKALIEITPAATPFIERTPRLRRSRPERAGSKRK